MRFNSDSPRETKLRSFTKSPSVRQAFAADRPAAPAPPSASAPPIEETVIAAARDGASELLTTMEVAARLRVTPRCLERWRTTGEGPRFVRLAANAVRYRLADVDAFIAARIRNNTAQ